MKALSVLLAVAAVPLLGATGYLFVLTLRSRRPHPVPYESPTKRLGILVPAHDEAAGIARTVQNLLALDYPTALFEVVVVADNCRDDTAARARAAGARVLERFDDARRGKGYALAHGFEAILADATVDAVVVVDADTLVSPNLLRAFDARLVHGADAVQADYAVGNPGASWRTQLMAIAFGMFHVVRSRGRESLGLSCGLRGNGMCFSRAVLADVPHDAFSVVEDLEYGIRLGERGYRVHYAGEAHAYGEMVASEKASRSQRQRWEGGRRQIAWRHAPRLLARALRERDPMLADLAIDLLVPPLSLLAGATVAGLASSVALALLARRPNLPAALFATSGAFLAAYVARGWQVSGTGLRGLGALACAPVYVAWKVVLPFRGSRRARDEWVRTARAGESG